MKIGYLINQYPKVSHTFIRREILALERIGFQVTRLALRGWAEVMPDPEDVKEQTVTTYLLRSGAIKMAAAVLSTFLASPFRWFSALKLALKMGHRADRPLPLHIIYFAEACIALKILRQAGVGHLHAHFGTNTAEVAMLVHCLGGVDGPTYSFTVHGPEEFDKPEFLHLGEKIRHARFVVAISSFGRSQLYRWAALPFWSKIHVVHCGIERDFHNVEVIPPSGSTFVCVGRLSEQKGHLLLIDAYIAALRRGADFDLVLAGDGELRGEIEASVQNFGIAHRVRITGWISSAQVRSEILRARALILPSFAEGLPVVLMEAMALHRPVISTSIAGIPELVKHGENGWLVPAGDVSSLADAMIECMACPLERLAQMGLAAHRNAIKRHDIDREAAKLAALFKQLDTDEVV